MKISIGVPIFGVDKYIERCARSLFEQSYKDIEYIFVNDCTPDCSMSILKNVLEEYPARKQQVVIINNEKNIGLAQTRNTIIENCTGDFIYNVDSDDYIELDTIELLVEKQKETNADIISSHIIVNDNIKRANYVTPNYKTSSEMVDDLTSQNSHHELCSKLIRRELFNYPDVKVQQGHDVGEDWMVTPKIAYYANSVALVPKFLYHYFQENENSYMFVSKKNMPKLIEQDIKTLCNLLFFFKVHNENKYIKNLSSLLTNFIKRGLYYGIETKNHNFYKKILSYHKLIDNEYKSLLWGNSIIKKHIIKSFYLRLFVQKTINFFPYHR